MEGEESHNQEDSRTRVSLRRRPMKRLVSSIILSLCGSHLVYSPGDTNYRDVIDRRHGLRPVRCDDPRNAS